MDMLCLFTVSLCEGGCYTIGVVDAEVEVTLIIASSVACLKIFLRCSNAWISLVGF